MLQKTKKIWFNGKIIDWDDAQIHVLTPSLHYGDAVFEGIRFYNTEKGPSVFRLKEHVDRLLYSAQAISMDIPFSKNEIIDAIKKIVKLNEIEEGYIRPIAVFGYGAMGLKHAKEAPVQLFIAVWPWPAYLGESAVRIKTSSFIRIHPKSSVADAKISGHYINSILASLEAKKNGYDEALLLDYEGNIAEGPGENIFFVKKGVIITPPLKKQILAGITRDSIITIAKDIGIKVEERNIKLDEAYKAEEAFFTGTAVEVTAIKEIDNKIIGSGEIGPITQRIKNEFLEIVRGRNKKYEKWLSYID